MEGLGGRSIARAALVGAQTGPQFHHRRIPKGEGFGHQRLARRSRLASLTRLTRSSWAAGPPTRSATRGSPTSRTPTGKAGIMRATPAASLISRATCRAEGISSWVQERRSFWRERASSGLPLAGPRRARRTRRSRRSDRPDEDSATRARRTRSTIGPSGRRRESSAARCARSAPPRLTIGADVCSRRTCCPPKRQHHVDLLAALELYACRQPACRKP